MKNKSIFSFKDLTSIGIFNVPLNAIIQIDNVNGLPKVVILISSVGLSSVSTIQDFLNDTTLYKDITDVSPYLKLDGSIQMANGYIPVNALDIATKEYIDSNTSSIQKRIYNEFLTYDKNIFFTDFHITNNTLIFIDGVLQDPSIYSKKINISVYLKVKTIIYMKN